MAHIAAHCWGRVGAKCEEWYGYGPGLGARVCVRIYVAVLPTLYGTLGTGYSC